TFYVYRLTSPYVFNELGNYSVNITSFNAVSSDGCEGGNDKTIAYTVNVVAGVNANFNIDYDKCISENVKLTDVSDGIGHAVTQWNWSYNNGTTPLPEPINTVKNPELTNPADNAAGNYTLVAINSIGCYHQITKALPASPLP